MEQDSLKMFSFLLKLVLLLQMTNSIYQFQLGATATQPELYERMSKIEAVNRLQANEISVLKMKSNEDRSEILQLRDRVDHLEASIFTNQTNNQEMLERKKRPVRLLPPRLLKSKDKIKNETEEDAHMKRFYGPPTSCSDLNALGYTLNGYYLVKGIQSEKKKTGIQTVYCKFKQPQSNQLGEMQFGYETKIGVVDVKTSPVHFFVIRHGDFSNDNGKNKMIRFQHHFLNEGNGFDWENQRFSAPYPGTYFFALSGSKNYFDLTRVSICFRLNEKIIGEALSSVNTYFGSFSYQLSIKLDANDKIDLELAAGTVFIIHFTGWMVEQDLLI